MMYLAPVFLFSTIIFYLIFLHIFIAGLFYSGFHGLYLSKFGAPNILIYKFMCQSAIIVVAIKKEDFPF